MSSTFCSLSFSSNSIQKRLLGSLLRGLSSTMYPITTRDLLLLILLGCCVCVCVCVRAAVPCENKMKRNGTRCRPEKAKDQVALQGAQIGPLAKLHPWTSRCRAWGCSRGSHPAPPPSSLQRPAFLRRTGEPLAATALWLFIAYRNSESLLHARWDTSFSSFHKS